MENRKISGSCLCGKVCYEYSAAARVFQYCHCSRCRKFTGSVHGANIIVDPEHFHWISGQENVGRYELPDAKHFATAFCRNCGSSLPWLSKSGKAVVIPAGTLDEDPGIKPVHNIFYAFRAPWYEDASVLPRYDRLPEKK